MLSIANIRPTYMIVNLDNIAFNMQQIKKLVGDGTLITAVVKANAYGLGSPVVAETLLANGADRLGVATLEEAEELRDTGIKCPIVVMGYTSKNRAAEVAKYDIEQAVYSFDVAEALSEAGKALNKKVKIHIKIDTGMGRLGFLPNEESIEEIKKINKLDYVEIEALFTHFATAAEEDKTYTYKQFDEFISFCDILRKENISFKLRHCANSPALVELPQTHLEMVRAGEIMYGIMTTENMKKKLTLKPVMSVITHISNLKTVDGGFAVSYGRRFISSGKTKVATLPIGFADGYSRLLTGKGKAFIRNKTVPLIGTICMDQCMADVTEIENVEIGDTVELIGEKIPIEEVANLIGTIRTEIMCMLSRRLPRVYMENGQIKEIKDYLNNKP